MSEAGSVPKADRVILWIAVAAALIGLVGGFFASRALHRASPPDAARYLTNFTLIDCAGRTVTRAALTNQFLVVNFVFTSCSVSCLQVSRNMARIQEMVTGQDDVRLVSFTVDPRTDTPRVLAKFAARIGADTNRWFLLTGNKAQLYEVIETSFLGRSGDPAWSTMPGGFMHADRIAVVDPQGKVRTFFDGMKNSTPQEVTNRIAQLRHELPNP